jgi:hypothetical protein
VEVRGPATGRAAVAPIARELELGSFINDRSSVRPDHRLTHPMTGTRGRVAGRGPRDRQPGAYRNPCAATTSDESGLTK